jgi:hypothetical protein
MAFYPQTGYSSYPQYGFPTTFAPVQQQQIRGDAASQHEGSQVGDVQSHSVSGFAAQPIDAGFYGGFPVQSTFIGAPAAYPATYGATVIPGAPVCTYGAPVAQSLVPVAQPVIRRPGYNERLVAWRNRQKAFNRYKRDTKQAIKHSNQIHYQNQATYLAPQSTVLAAPAFGAAPIYGGFGQSTIIGAPAAYPAYGATYIGGAYPFGAFPIQQGFEQQHIQQDGGEFSSFSNQNDVQQQNEEPEIRGTQV